MQQIKLNHINVYSFSTRKELIDMAINEKKILIAINAEKILKKDCALQSIINQNIGYPDGVGAVWALKKKGYKKTIKIPGVELWLDIIKELHNAKNFYFVGSTDDVINNTVTKLKQEFPAINILNFRNGFIKTDEDKELLINDLTEKKPDIVFVAMGTPKQEILMDELKKAHPALYQGLGGSFDVYSGKVKRAPKIFISLGIEWLYRLLKEPTRIKRQLVLVKFFWLLIIGKI
ncbi:MAG: glycosyl transferase [Bacteroidetes bacterium GWA2_30_7]|nr:MAG: glycosyl transferase [Bacteroidetes bacterium GWA2_30_7]